MLDETLLLTPFDDATLTKGELLLKRRQVRTIRPNKATGELKGDVQGTARTPYQVTLRETARFGRMISLCTCPVGLNCKHGAALALAYLDRESAVTDPYQHWFKHWQDRAKPPAFKNGAEDQGALSFQLFPIEADHRDPEPGIGIRVGQRKRLKRGGLGKFKERPLNELLSTSDKLLAPEDKDLLLLLHSSRISHFKVGPFKLRSRLQQQALEQLLARHPGQWEPNDQSLHLGQSLPLCVQWHVRQDKHSLEFTLPAGTPFVLLPFESPWYLEPATGATGPLETRLPTPFLQQLQQLPPLSDTDAQHFGREVLADISQQDLPQPLPQRDGEVVQPLRPHLSLSLEQAQPVAEVSWRYGELGFAPVGMAPQSSNLELDGRTLWVKRDPEGEQQALAILRESELVLSSVVDLRRGTVGAAPKDDRRQVRLDGDNSKSGWNLWLAKWQEKLEQAGWHLSVDAQFQPVLIDNLDLVIEEQDHWFDLGLSVELDGQQIALVPLLLSWLRQNPDWQTQADVLLEQEQGPPLKIRHQALTPIFKLLSELGQRDGDTLKLPQSRAAVLNQLPDINHWRGGDRVRALAQKLEDFKGIEPAPPSQQLQATLRPYQQEGLNWLTFLHQYGFGGILADDMGLGKTLQALAHLQRLKSRGELTGPALLICPTSLVGNWRREAERFTPDLKLLILHGSGRKQLFDRIPDADLVITTYPLVARDEEILTTQLFSLAILDEAQTIKSPKAKMTLAVKNLQVGQRLCLTGTPMENHLGELWSLFDFIMPGFLGNLSSFNKHFRTPIEKEGNAEIQQWLLTKIQPFMLRRTKDTVATELPPKTEIIHRIELPRGQRTLYETVRGVMEAKVRSLLNEKGLANSQIEFLDALLKLRQICCAPQLLKLEQARSVTDSAKLDFLMELLPEMLEEGRRVLIFSQFTQMLDLIAARLKDFDIGYTMLTGQTRKRDQAIDAFQSGQVPVFLISLKAGGVGLNLTEADTVIHFDPWWNPAAENQATDRAYRIGQDKPVFVYKLICEQTVEERVLELQQHKQALADSLFDRDSKEGSPLASSDQLLSLFAE